MFLLTLLEDQAVYYIQTAMLLQLQVPLKFQVMTLMGLQWVLQPLVDRLDPKKDLNRSQKIQQQALSLTMEEWTAPSVGTDST